MSTKSTILFFALSLLLAATASAQGPIGGFFSAKGEGSVTVSYTYTQYDQFYVADNKMDGAGMYGEISQDIYSLYAKYGITDRLTVVAIIPYIDATGKDRNEGFDGPLRDDGFQDFSLWAKYRPFSADFEGGRFDGLVAAGVSIPDGYEPGGILSLGSGAFATDLKLGGQLNLDGGFFATFIAGYSLRGNAESELPGLEGRDLDVPNAINLMGKVGYAASRFYVEAWIFNQNSTDGIDIGGEGFSMGNFPETEVDYTSIGASVYVPIAAGFGASVGYGTTIDGRNIGDASYISGGITYNFGR